MDQALLNQLLQLGGSLAAILAITWFASKLELGGDERIRDEDHAYRLADEAVAGFKPVEMTIDKAGYGALLRDANGRILVLKRHGTFFAGRVIEHRPEARLDQELLTIHPADKQFGAVTLNLGKQAQIWAASLRRLKAPDKAPSDA